MAWTTPKVWTSETLTSSDMNTYISDNLSYLKGITDGVGFSGVEAGRATNQSISNATDTDLSFTAEGFDYGGWFGGSGTAITVPSGAIPSGYSTVAVGIYLRGRFASNGTGYRKLSILVNGASQASISVDANSGAETEVAITDFALVEATDVITFQAYQNSGGNLNLEISSARVIRHAPVA